jgi:hypothetical protein
VTFLERMSGVNDSHRQVDPKRGTLSKPVADHRNLPALQLNQLTRNREAETEPPARAADAGVGLPKTIEDVGKKFL